MITSSANSPAGPSEDDDVVADHIDVLQGPLRGYISSLLGTMDGVDDVLQEANQHLWEQRAKFKRGTSFRAWAYRVAYFKTLAARRDRAREARHVFSEAFVERLAEIAETREDERTVRLKALRCCLEKLRPQDRRLLRVRYVDGESLSRYAESQSVSAAAIHKTISRLRLSLRQCINRHLAEDKNL